MVSHVRVKIPSAGNRSRDTLFIHAGDSRCVCMLSSGFCDFVSLCVRAVKEK